MIMINTKTLILSTILSVGALAGPGAAQQPARKFELQPISPKLSTLIPATTKLETVAAGFGFTEGPVWDPAGFLYVSDEAINKIFKVYRDGRKAELIALGDPDGSTFDRQHHLLNCASVLRAIIQLSADGHYKVLADRYEGN